MMERPPSIVFFDLDGTITHTDTFIAFIKYTHGILWWIIGLFVLSPYIVAYYFLEYPNDKLKERFFSFFFKGQSAEKVQIKGGDFALNILPGLCREGAMKVLDNHKKEGHKIYIVTASAHLWTAAWCQQQGFELIATRFAQKDGRYTGAIKGANCHGKEKRHRVQPIIDSQPQSIVYAYGDEKADLYFLSLAKHAYCMPLSMENMLKHKLLKLTD